MNFRGTEYMGTANIATTTSNQELVPSPPDGWTIGYSLYKFSFRNYSDCHIKINGGNQIFLPANTGFSSDINDAPITSFVVVESGVKYIFLAAY